MIRNIFIFFLWLCVWLLLSWPPKLESVLLGIPVSIFVLLMTSDMLAKKQSSPRSPLRCLWFLYYAVLFIWECFKANFDVAYRVLHPALPIRPGTVKVKTSLKSDEGLTFLANSITLTPGTTTVDIDRQAGIIYVHWLYVKGDCPDGYADLKIVGKFENILKRIFD